MNNYASFVARILSVINDLPDAERRIAEFTLDFPGDLASYSASEMAQLAGVSNATVTRFIRRLGYADFNEARVSVREERKLGSPLMLDAKRRPAPDTVESNLAYSRANLEATFARISEDTIDAIVQSILSAKNVWIAGFRSSQSFASYFKWQLFQFLPSCRLLPGPGETIGEYMAHVERGDCLVAFGVRRRARQLQHLVTSAHDSGAKTIFLADHLYGEPLNVDWFLRCDTKAPSALDNHVAVLAVCDLLITRIFHSAGPKGRRRLASVEAAHETTDELSDL